MENWSRVKHFTEWINKYDKMLQFVKVEDVYLKGKIHQINLLVFERKKTDYLKDVKLISAIKEVIQQIY